MIHTITRQSSTKSTTTSNTTTSRRISTTYRSTCQLSWHWKSCLQRKSLTSNTRSTDSQLNAGTPMPTMNLITIMKVTILNHITMWSLTIQNLIMCLTMRSLGTSGGDYYHLQGETWHHLKGGTC